MPWPGPNHGRGNECPSRSRYQAPAGPWRASLARGRVEEFSPSFVSLPASCCSWCTPCSIHHERREDQGPRREAGRAVSGTSPDRGPGPSRNSSSEAVEVAARKRSRSRRASVDPSTRARICPGISPKRMDNASKNGGFLARRDSGASRTMVTQNCAACARTISLAVRGSVITAPYRRWDSNPHSRGNTILNRTRLPFRHAGTLERSSGRDNLAGGSGRASGFRNG